MQLSGLRSHSERKRSRSPRNNKANNSVNVRVTTYNPTSIEKLKVLYL